MSFLEIIERVENKIRRACADLCMLVVVEEEVKNVRRVFLESLGAKAARQFVHYHFPHLVAETTECLSTIPVVHANVNIRVLTAIAEIEIRTFLVWLSVKVYHAPSELIAADEKRLERWEWLRGFRLFGVLFLHTS